MQSSRDSSHTIYTAIVEHYLNALKVQQIYVLLHLIQ